MSDNQIVEKTAGNAVSQNMGGFKADRWSGNDQLWWTGAKPGDRLSVEIPDVEAGEYSIELVLTQAADYGIVQLSLDDQKLGKPFDAYAGDVKTSGQRELGTVELAELASGRWRFLAPEEIKRLSVNPGDAKKKKRTSASSRSKTSD